MLAARKALPAPSYLLEELQDYIDSDMGFCTHCKDFTREMTEPDAEGYDCPECDQNTVMGAELAVITGIVCIIPEPEEVE